MSSTAEVWPKQPVYARLPSFQTIADTPSPAVALHPYAEANIINTVVFALNTSAFKLFFFRES